MKIKKILYTVSILLVILFLIIIIIDYLNYDALINSAPFTVNIIVRGIEFILPSIMVFIVAKFICKKDKTN